jgi:hypothetical protein
MISSIAASSLEFNGSWSGYTDYATSERESPTTAGEQIVSAMWDAASYASAAKR